MDLVVEPGSVEGGVVAPPSKSYTHRALFAALLARGDSAIVNPLLSGDTMATIDSVRRFGASTRWSGHLSLSSGPLAPPGTLYCRGSGTTIRIATAISVLVGEPVILYGDASLNRRPMLHLAEALRSLGARVECAPGCTPPLLVRGPRGGPLRDSVDVAGWVSSQFVSALLFISPILGLEVRVSGRVRSRPYIDLTVRVLEAFGLRVSRRGYEAFRVRGYYKPSTFTVPGDYSSASFMLAAGALAGSVTVGNLDPGDPQADRAILDILESMGARVVRGDGWVRVEEGPLEAIDVDLSDSPDIAPIVSVLAAFARGTSMIRGVGHLAFKESNRLEAIVSNLRRIGVEASVVGGEAIVVRGGPVEGGSVDSYGDHRIAMAFAIAGLASRRPVRVFNSERISDSYPSFVRDLKSIGARVVARV